MKEFRRYVQPFGRLHDVM